MSVRLPHVVVLAVLVALSLGACGKNVIRPEGAEHSVTELVSKKTGFMPTDVSCPSDVEAKEGGTFDCSFTGPHDTPYTAHMTIEKVNGEHVLFNISTEPTK